MHTKIKSFLRNQLVCGVIEVVLLVVWVLLVGKAYLDMNPDMWPSGGQEYFMSLQNQYNWPMLLKCGTCFYWNGFTNGGAPSFIDIHGAWLNPIVMIATFALGVANSGKVVALVGLFIAGLSQLWLGKIFQLSRFSRIWMALLLTASGAVVGRLQMANVPLLLSTAMCMLVIPAVIDLTLNGGFKKAIILGVVLGLAILSGQGYLQIGLFISLLPFLVYLLLGKAPSGTVLIKQNWKYFFYAGIFGILIASPLLIPLTHNSSIIDKDSDPLYTSSQPVSYSLLNLVIDDADYYFTNAIKKTPFPYLYINYIGWIPVVLAVWGIAHTPKQYRKMMFGFLFVILVVYLTSSAELFKFLEKQFSVPSFGWIRNPGPIQSLAVPFILILAGFGIDHLLNIQLPKIRLTAEQQENTVGRMDLNLLKWAAFLLLVFFSLKSTYDFSKPWLYVLNAPTDLQVIESVKTENAEWVQPPAGEYAWFTKSMDNNLKIRYFFRPWKIKSVEVPKAYLELSRVKDDVNLPEYDKSIGDFVLLKRVENEYAYIQTSEAMIPCKAYAAGGNIDVECDSTSAGMLYVLEHAVSGWTVNIDGKPNSLIKNDWLAVAASSGKHSYSFRYLPWDAPLGLGLGAIGWLSAFGGYLFFAIRDRKMQKTCIEEPVDTSNTGYQQKAPSF